MMLQKQEADGSCVAYGMLIDHSESVESSEKVVTPVIDATVAGVKVPITILAGGPRIQRIRLNFTKDLLEKLFAENSDVTCVFDVHWGSKRTSCTSDLSFSVRTTLSGEKK